MPLTDLARELRPATLDDAAVVADLETSRDPSDPRDPVLLRYWWQMGDELEHLIRRVRVVDGAATAFAGASHERWVEGETRFGTVRVLLRYDAWDDTDFASLVEVGETWLRREGATITVARVREDFRRELAVLDRMGFREERRMRMSELDLVARREHILETVVQCRADMRNQGVQIHPLSQDDDAECFHKLYQVMTESEQDIPRSVPWRVLTFDEWRHFWFDNPAVREDRVWIARESADVVGVSMLDSPVVRGVPWTAYTGTARRVRGRGIARALKYESMAQAIEAGYPRVRTNNDADNPPILRINAEMGYHLIAPVIELHRRLQ